MSTSNAAEPTPTPVTDGTTTAPTGRDAVGGPGWAVNSHDGQSTLKLHAGISIMAVVLCLFVTWIFIHLGTITPAIIFGVMALVCLGIFVGCRARLAKVRGSHDSGGH